MITEWQCCAKLCHVALAYLLNFFVDSFRCSAMSLIHKDAGVDCSGYFSKARPWFFGVADPSTGKSHAADPHVNICEAALKKHANYAMGQEATGFHIPRTRTYAALEDVIKDTEGYALVLSGEGKPYLSPTWPSKGYFDDAHGLPFDRMMDCAYGKGFGGDTKADRTAMKRQIDAGQIPKTTYQPSTNIEIGLVVQDSVYQEWLVTGEANHNEGLCQRFLITFGRGRMVGELKHKRFASDVYRPLVQEVFERILKWIGPKQSVSEPGQHYGVFDFSDSDERLVKNVRMVCSHAADVLSHSLRRKLLTGLGKSGY